MTRLNRLNQDSSNTPLLIEKRQRTTHRLSQFIAVLAAAMVFISACAPAASLPPTQNPVSTAVTVIPSPAPAFTSTPMDTLAPTASLELEPFGAVSISASEIEFNLNGEGTNVDSIAFWEAADPAQSLMFVTSKGNASIEVYRYPFQSQLTTILCGSASNGVWVDQGSDILFITERNASNVCAYELPSLAEKGSLSFSTAANGGDSEPNLTILHLLDGQSRIYISYDDTVFYHDAGTGAGLGAFTPSEGLETMVGDDFSQALYIPDEGGRSGVYLYDQDGNPAGPKFGDRSIFQSDAEGIWVYRCQSGAGSDTGAGWIVVSDQKDDLTDFEVFDRRSKTHLGKININGVNNTDGIAIAQQASPAYPFGLLAVVDDDTSVVGVGWDTIFAKTGLACPNLP
jgi:hypothetical protein